MDEYNDRCLIECTWKDVRKKISQIDSKLANIIDNLSPSDEFTFYLARYPYGELIVDKGVFQVPNKEGNIVPLLHSSISNKIKENLSYNKMIPTGLITQNSIETFFSAESHTIPASLYGVGDMVALWHVLEAEETYQTGPVWSISSGARTIYMLPKISDKNSYRSLKLKYNIKNLPRALNDHWQLFYWLANHKNFSQPWFSEVIFFSKKWFEQQNDEKFSHLFLYFFKDVWYTSCFRRNQFVLDFAFSLAQKNGNLKPNPYLADTARCLISIGDGTVPGLAPAINNFSAPIEGLQKVFIEDYNLKKYAPVIVHPHHFSFSSNRPVYYSLEVPTTTIFSPRSSRLASKMVDMRELKHITSVMLSLIIKGDLQVEETPLLNLAENVSYKFYHSEKDQYDEITTVSELAESDQAFTTTIVDKKQYHFPEFSPLFRGCVSISKADS